MQQNNPNRPKAEINYGNLVQTLKIYKIYDLMKEYI